MHDHLTACIGMIYLKMNLYKNKAKDPLKDVDKVLINRPLTNRKVDIYYPLENDIVFKMI